MSDTRQSALASVMKVPAIYIQMYIYVFVLLSTQPALSYSVQKPAFPVISPNRLQFFEYEPIFVSCVGEKGTNAWRVMREPYNISPANVSEACSIPAPSCTINVSFQKHSGEYWCENDKGEKSNSLNISVTAGAVILSISAQPVKEGSDVTLRCINRNTERTHISDFYRNGLFLKTYYKTDMTLSKVSKSNEGLYRCNIPGVGESPESWLAVVKLLEEEEEEEGSDEEKQPVTNQPLTLTISLCTIFILLLLVIGLILYKKNKALKKEAVTDPKDITYSVVKKPMKRNGGNTGNKSDDVTYAAIELKPKGRQVSRVTPEQMVSDQQSTYSIVALKRGN